MIWLFIINDKWKFSILYTAVTADGTETTEVPGGLYSAVCFHSTMKTVMQSTVLWTLCVTMWLFHIPLHCCRAKLCGIDCGPVSLSVCVCYMLALHENSCMDWAILGIQGLRGPLAHYTQHLVKWQTWPDAIYIVWWSSPVDHIWPPAVQLCVECDG